MATKTIPVLLLFVGAALAAAPTITTSSPLPRATAGTSYSQPLTATGGTPPYTWTLASGSPPLPAGLTLNGSSGSLSGTPSTSTSGTFLFTVMVTDSDKQTAVKALSLTIAPPLVLSTSSPLPAGIAGVPYSLALGVSGGTPPYQWTLTTGSLPAGLTLNASSGLISGSTLAYGAYSFTAQAADSTGIIGARTYSLSINLPDVSAVTIGGLSSTAGPATQLTVSLSLAAGYPLPLNGQLTLAFQPDAVNPSDDPAIQFSTGGRTAAFTISANSTQAIFSPAQVALQTGTVAGLIQVTVSFSVDQNDKTPSPAPGFSIRIARAAPAVRSVSIVRTSSGFEVHATGFSTDRQVTQATYQFAPAAGQTLQSSSTNVPLNGPSGTWYQSAASAQFGSQFTLVQPFTVQGSISSLSSVTVQLTNAQGSSQGTTATF